MPFPRKEVLTYFITTACPSWTGKKEVLVDIKNLRDVYQAVDYQREKTKPLCQSAVCWMVFLQALMLIIQ